MNRSLFPVLGTLLVVAWTACAQDYGRAGYHGTFDATVDVVRPDGSRFSALVYGPTPVPPLRFPVITFGHGFLSPPQVYRETCRHLASWGFIVVATQSGLEPFPDHEEYAKDMSLCLTQLALENDRPGSPFYGQVDTNRFGASGHSMGGGASILAASMDPRISAVANMAAAETFPTSAVAAAAGLDIPLCLVMGNKDRIAVPWRHQIPMYQSADAPRLLPVIRGGSHCGFVDFPLPDAVCDEADIPLPKQLAEARHLLTAFFLLYLKDDLSAWSAVWGPRAARDRDVLAIADAGVALEPPTQRWRVAPGTAAEVQLTVTNTGDQPASYVMGVEGGGSFVTPELAPGESTQVLVTLTLPEGVSAATTYIYARPAADLRTGRFASVILRARR